MAAEIRVEQYIDAPVETVWNDIADLASHTEWMADAESIMFMTDSRSGVGTAMEVLTRIGPFSTKDTMEFTAWEPPHRMAISHRGLVNGVGEFRLAVQGLGTSFVWEETLHFPWRFGGPVGALVGGRLLTAVWKRNLKKLAARFESAASSP